MKSAVLFLLLVFSFTAGAYDLFYQTYSYPNSNDVQQISAHSQNKTLKVCCEFPTKEDAGNIINAGINHLIVHAWHFPTAEQTKILDTLAEKGIEYEMIVEQSFPSPEETIRINNSLAKKLTVKQWNFPTWDEVGAFNGFTVEFVLELDYPEYPLPEHMTIMNTLKPEFTIAFKNRMVPGVGYANFFNNLRTKKHFVALEQFPWGDDAIGFNALERSTLEVIPDERIMPQDIPTLNAFDVRPMLHLVDQAPYDSNFYQLVGKVNAKRILIFDDGYGELMKPSNTIQINTISSPVSIVLNRFL